METIYKMKDLQDYVNSPEKISKLTRGFNKENKQKVIETIKAYLNNRDKDGSQNYKYDVMGSPVILNVNINDDLHNDNVLYKKDIIFAPKIPCHEIDLFPYHNTNLYDELCGNYTVSFYDTEIGSNSGSFPGMLILKSTTGEIVVTFLDGLKKGTNIVITWSGAGYGELRARLANSHAIPYDSQITNSDFNAMFAWTVIADISIPTWICINNNKNIDWPLQYCKLYIWNFGSI